MGLTRIPQVCSRLDPARVSETGCLLQKREIPHATERYLPLPLSVIFFDLKVKNADFLQIRPLAY